MRILVVPAVAAVLVFGLWITAGKITNSYELSIALSVAWLVVASAVIGKSIKRWRPDLRGWARTGTVLTSVVVAAWFYWTSIRETTVNERVVRGVRISVVQPESAMAAERPMPAAPMNVVSHVGRWCSGASPSRRRSPRRS
jgi:hypothetical protein